MLITTSSTICGESRKPRAWTCRASLSEGIRKQDQSNSAGCSYQVLLMPEAHPEAGEIWVDLSGLNY